jgi:hypothetical protein
MKYRLLKVITIVLSPLYLPLGMYTAIRIDGGDYFPGFIALAGGMAFCLTDAVIYWYLIEHQRDRR